MLTCDVPAIFAQHDIAFGQWRTHFSYHSIEHIASTPEKIFASAQNAIMVLDRSALEMETLTRLNGLSGSGISAMNADPDEHRVLVGYADGLLDIIDDNAIISFDRLADASLSTSRTINHIGFHHSVAYLSTDFGVVVFDLDQLEIRETWRDLGLDGNTLRILSSVVLNDSIYLATEEGVLAGALSDNLLDYTMWTRYNEDDFSGTVNFVNVFDGSAYAAVDNAGIFKYDGITWTQLPFLQNTTFNFLSSSEEQMLIGTPEELWSLTGNGMLENISSPGITNPQDAVSDVQLWIGDQTNGLILLENGNSQKFLANGPSFAVPFRLRYVDDAIYSMAGGPSPQGQPLDKPGSISFFRAGSWTNEQAVQNDITGAARVGDLLYLSSFGGGIQSGPVQTPTTSYNESNSTLVNSNPPGDFVLISDLGSDGNRLWAVNYNTTSPLHLYAEGQWQGFSFPFFAARFPTELAIDVNGNVWYSVNPLHGGGLVVFDAGTGSSVYLTDQVNSGGLPDRAIHSLASDRDGSMWVGTGGGVAYFPTPSSAFNGTVNAIRPIFENRFLLDGERITAIAVDGGNRKWIGTDDGVWLFSPSADEQIFHFTVDNSPLPSNSVTTIAIDPVSGEVFFGTPEGIISYRSDASEGQPYFEHVRIFPNPVTPEFNGLVGITGLATDATVKITEVDGKLVSQMNANGGSATWNVRNGNGVRVSTGIYLVFCATNDGSERYVGKIAVVE